MGIVKTLMPFCSLRGAFSITNEHYKAKLVAFALNSNSDQLLSTISVFADHMENTTVLNC